MPHSSGGGSSSSGSHGGSSSSSSGSSNPRFGNTYYPGSHRYVYYMNNRPYYYFSDRPYTEADAKSRKTTSIIMGAAFSIIALVIMVIVIASSIHIPKPVATDYDTSIIIEDNAGVLSSADADELEGSFKSFVAQTGVTPAFVSVNQEDWSGSYDSLEIYAYKTYLNKFQDEKHWLLVYSSKGDRTNWEWEGMIGDDCGSMITADLEDMLTDLIQKNLWQDSRYTVSAAISDALAKVAEKANTTYFISSDENNPIVAILILVIFLVVGVVMLIKGLKMIIDDDPKVNSILCSTTQQEPKTKKCAYCSGVYIIGMHESCPHCGAPIETS